MNKRNTKYTEHATYQITCHLLSLLVQYQWVCRLNEQDSNVPVHPLHPKGK